MRVFTAIVLLSAAIFAQAPGSLKVSIEDDWHSTFVPAGREIEVEAHASLMGNKFSIAELTAGIRYGTRGLFELTPDRIISQKYIVRSMNGVSMIDVKIRAVFMVPTMYLGHQLTWYVDSLDKKTRRSQDSTARLDLVQKRGQK